MNPVTNTISATSSDAPRTTDRERLSAAAKQFEAIFVREMLSAARKTDLGRDILSSEGIDTFRQMQDENFAEIAAQTGAFGLATMIEAQLARFLPPGAQ